MITRRWRKTTPEAKIAAAALMAAALLLWLLVPVLGADEPVGTVGLRVMGQKELLSASTASVRVVVTDHLKDAPVRNALVSVRLARAEGGVADVLFVGRTDPLGTARAEFQVPDVPDGDYKLVVHAQARDLREKATQQVRIKSAFQVLLTTDKPIYQPTQTMHLRALALRLPRLAAAAGEQITLEVSDAKGNKVFKHTDEANDFGIVAADFTLADEVNMGRYKIKALLGDDEAEKTVTVKRYVLPKFKLTVDTDRDYYLPGQHVEGTVQADYFFGKPVAEARVVVKVKTFDFEFRDLATIEGTTSAEGGFSFETDLPASFVGQPVEQGKAFLQFEAGVTDQAEHTETAILTSTVAAADLEINAIPESGNLVPGVDNVVYVMVSRPTGEPAQAHVSLGAVTFPDGEQDILVQPPRPTDDLGIAQFTLPAAFTALLQPQELAGVPTGLRRMAGAFMAEQAQSGGEGGATVTIDAIARAEDGTEVHKNITLTADPYAPDTGLLLRTDRALYKVGDGLTATVLTGLRSGTVYFDVVKDRQTMLTQAAPIEGGRATTRIVLGPHVSGTAWLSAYVITPLGQVVRDQRPLYVDPSADLSIDVSADQDTYVPGSESRLDFMVKDAAGRPVAAALGINVVDESVFALQELQPGMEKVFFFLEQELMQPRYEIHGFEMPAIIATEPRQAVPASWERKDRAAQIIFASIEAPDLNAFEVDTYAERLEEAKQGWVEKLAPKVERIQTALQEYRNKHGKYPSPQQGVALLVREGFLEEDDLKDLWARDMLVEPAWAGTEELEWIVVISLGSDGKRDTLDDLVMPGYSPRGMLAGGGMRRGFWGPMGEEGEAMAIPMLAAAPGMAKDEGGAETTAAEEDGAGKESVRVRKYFPETMFFEPSLITGPDGRATLTMPMADSITTWRMACLASSATGQLGSTTRGLRCFQDFFIDIDLPVALTQNDHVSIPVAIYNYLPQEQTVRLELTRDPWFELSGDDTVEMTIASNDVDVRYFTIGADKIGDHQLTVHGMGERMSDAISRSIRVEPDGRKVEQTISDRLEANVEHTINIPQGAIEDASNILVKVYPGIFSQVVEGLDSILQMPFGCFEQTSAATYPNILVLDYMRTTGQVTPEIDMKASGFINQGYQRMVSYECPNHGFSWFGDEPANKMLTAYGLMEFHDMTSVHSVDQSVISRTQQWLLDQQQSDGPWKADDSYLHQESWGRIQNSDLLPTSYCTWALAATECRDEGVGKGATYVRQHWEEAEEPYSLAVCCNAMVAADRVLQEGDLNDATIEALEKLIDMAKTEGEKMWWESKITGITHSSGDCADLEATGYAGLALLTSGRHPGPTTQVINYLVSKKDPNGTWHSTQATILALKVMLLSQGKATQEIDAEIEVAVNGKQASAFALSPENADVMRLVDCRELVKEGENKLTISFGGKGSCLYQIVGRYYVPWTKPDVPAAEEALDIDVSYDRTTLAKDDMLTATVTVRNNTPATTSMIIVDLGVPPGFAVESGDLAELVDMDKIQKYKLTGRQIIVYFEKLEPRQVAEFSYRLRAKFPIRAKTPKSTVYEYYNPHNRATAAPEEIEVTG